MKLREPDTAGACVTIPHKEVVIPLLDELSPHAQAIGAVNAVTRAQGKLLGDNTDWLGVSNLLRPHLANADPTCLTAVVIGAGGTARAVCYALQQLHIPFSIWNRTRDRAEELARRFSGRVLEDLGDVKGVDIVVSTVPPTANLQLPAGLLKPRGIAVELVYNPRVTPLIVQAKQKDCIVIEGIEILLEQAIEGNRKEPPRKEMVAALQKRFAWPDPPLSFIPYLN